IAAGPPTTQSSRRPQSKQEWTIRSIERDDLDLRAPLRDEEARDARLHIESTRTGGAWIHDQPAALPQDRGAVRVAEHEHVARVAREHQMRRGASELVAVADVERQ